MKYRGLFKLLHGPVLFFQTKEFPQESMRQNGLIVLMQES